MGDYSMKTVLSLIKGSKLLSFDQIGLVKHDQVFEDIFEKIFE